MPSRDAPKVFSPSPSRHHIDRENADSSRNNYVNVYITITCRQRIGLDSRLKSKNKVVSYVYHSGDVIFDNFSFSKLISKGIVDMAHRNLLISDL
jgi:hypothetical protein